MHVRQLARPLLHWGNMAGLPMAELVARAHAGGDRGLLEMSPSCAASWMAKEATRAAGGACGG
jgi:hypothetical protein